jgi:hypothetical protein
MEAIFGFPKDLPRAKKPTDVVIQPKRSNFNTDKEFYEAFLAFCLDYDRQFRSFSPFGVSCLKEEKRHSYSRMPDIGVRGFKTYNEIQWEIYHIEREIRGDANWKLHKPIPGLTYTVENYVDWN